MNRKKSERGDSNLNSIIKSKRGLHDYRSVMNLSDYISDIRWVLLVCASSGLFFTLFLAALGIGAAQLFLLWICFCLILLSTVLCCWRKKQRRLAYLRASFDALEPKYLLAEIADTPGDALEQVYFQMLREALKSMTDQVAASRRQTREYQEFLEQWVHEIKLPVTGVQLLCENHRTDVTRKILAQTERMEQDIEKVLFYARLGSPEKDYLIREVSLRECVMDVLARNKQFLIENGASVHTDVSHSVRSDPRWLSFLLTQLISNSLKYRSDLSPVLDIISRDCDSYVELSVTDNGIGIRPSELPRIFDKGFVGSNGRATAMGSATGMGLYLCAQLCDRLGIEIRAESDWNQSTAIHLHFPKEQTAMMR